MTETAPETTGLTAVREALTKRPPGERSMSWLTQQLGLTRGASRHWKDVPVDYLQKISELTGVHPRVLRPDLAAMFDESAAVVAE